jgi:hypothetical protein
MLTPHRSSRVVLVASGRGAGDAGEAGPAVRRYRLVRVSPLTATAAPRIAPGKRS